jgi:predicted membrane GTPase involved in stress response
VFEVGSLQKINTKGRTRIRRNGSEWMSRTIEIDKAIDAALDASVSHMTIGISDREDGTLLQAFQQRLTEIKRMSPDLQRRFFRISKNFVE